MEELLEYGKTIEAEYESRSHNCYGLNMLCLTKNVKIQNVKNLTYILKENTLGKKI